MVIQKAKQIAKAKTAPVKQPAKVKKTRNRPFRTPYGGLEGQSVTTYRDKAELIIRDGRGGQIEIDPSEVPSLFLAILETDRKSKTQH